MKWLSDLIKKKSLIFVGAELTVLYFMIFGFICFHYVDFSKKLSLNELGDLLAGAFAPLAFMWMVITILMQGKELRLQREELSMQRKELANSSQQLERQSNVMERQLTKEQKEAQQKEIEGKIIDFIERLVDLGCLSSDYKSEVFGGRINTYGFFQHYNFEHFFVRLHDEYQNSNDERRLMHGNKIKAIIFVGEEFINLAEGYGLKGFVEKIGFIDFFAELKFVFDKYYRIYF